MYAGAAPDTGNLGVSALCFGALRAFYERLPGARVTVLDFGRGEREWWFEEGGARHRCLRVGAVRTRRWHRPESMARIDLSMRLGGLGNPAARAMLESDAVLDISGGDSFTDLYGAWRFASVAWVKLAALRAGAPLVLLPQTYGPFQGSASRAVAERIVRHAGMCWARDERSFEVLRGLLGSEFDPARHRTGVDVAFVMGVREPGTELGREVDTWARGGDRGLTIGFNVSGLIYLSEDGGRAQYGLRADYREAVERFVRRVLERSDARVVLMPHVISPPGHYESDNDACERLRARLGDVGKGRVAVAPGLDDPREAKWLISRMGWFCGTRMHSTIAGLSTGVPTAAIAYSDKTRGVFETCGQGEHVADPRALGTDELVEALWTSFEGRERARGSLGEALPGVLGRAGEQMGAICDFVGAGRGALRA